eukprot:TRINITY_DN71080_c0_g1_i1.p1 TRINITY_DN71080_c0_g1~~TRINITY_DN71080_c0_g1_i1.p1  ORF type:complete len:157 (-),score=4.23 TRINITY_DN71080_c0_g1_i1:72-485(-)
MGQRVCTCCVKRELEFQEVPAFRRPTGQELGAYTIRPRLPYGELRSQVPSGSAASSPYEQAAEVNSMRAAQGLPAGPCIVCREVGANTICLPCGHLLVCYRCSLRYVLSDGSGLHPDTRCPCCKQSVKSFQRTLLHS